MDQPFLFPLDDKWDGIFSFLDSSINLPLTQYHRLLLSGGGTLTNALYAILGSPVYIEVISQNTIEADQRQTMYLELKQSEKGLLREIWIINEKGEKLVYANSFLPINGLNSTLHEAILSKKYSLGDLIEKMKIPSFKDKFGFGTLRSNFLCDNFQASENSMLWYRHFRLSAPQYLLASIYEVFSPKLFNL